MNGLSFLAGVVVGGAIALILGALIMLESAYEAAEEQRRDAFDWQGDSRVNLTHLAQVRQARAMQRREGVGGNW